MRSSIRTSCAPRPTRHLLRLALFAAFAFLLVDPVTAQVVMDSRTVGQGGPHEVTVQLQSSSHKGKEYESLVIAEIRDTVSDRAIDLSVSPLWRLDLRKPTDLDPPQGGESRFAPWTLVPPRNNGLDLNDPIRWGLAGPLWFLTDQFGGLTSLEIVDIGPDAVDLVWTGIQLPQFDPAFAGTLDVRVLVRFDVAGYPDLSLQVDLDNPAAGGGGAAVLSAEFPCLLAPPLEFGGEPDPQTHGWVDDLLLSPYFGGGIIPEPVAALEFDNINHVDSVHLDLSSEPGAPYQPRRITYPAYVQTQFAYYYDLESPDLGDVWATYDGNQRMVSRGTWPSQRGGGTGLFLAALDPTMGVKRFQQFAIHHKKKNKPPNRVALGFRHFFKFTVADRVPLTAGTSDWTFFVGNGSPASPNTEQSVLGYPLTVRVLQGDWCDAVEEYRAWFEGSDGSDGLLRDAGGAPIPLRDRADAGLALEDQIPAPYLSLAAIFGFAETGPNGLDALSQRAIGDEFSSQSGGDYVENARAFLNWMRQGSAGFGGTAWFGVGHGEGMQADGGTGPAVKSSGNEAGNKQPRAGLVEFFKALRNTDPGAGWDGSVLAVLNRDTGNLDPATAPPELLSRTERGVPMQGPSNFVGAYGRQQIVDNTLGHVEESLGLFKDPTGTESQVDLVFLSGKSSEARAEYSIWFQSDPLLQLAGCGSSWAVGLTLAHQGMRTVQPAGGATASPNLFTGSERSSEQTLKHGIPLGPVVNRPVAATIDDDGIVGPGAQRALWEPVPMLSMLWHEYALLRGSLKTHGQFALHFFAKPLQVQGGPPPPLPTAAQYEESQRLRSHHLAMDVLHHGRIPTVFVSGDQAEVDWTFSDRVRTGPADKALPTYSAGSAMWFVRQLVRARMTAQEFLVSGRRLRDAVLLEDPANSAGWFAPEIKVLQHGEAALPGKDRALPFSDISVPRLVHGTWTVPGGAETPVGQVDAFVAVANPSQDAGATNFDTVYRVGFDPRWWDLAPGQYVLRPYRLDWGPPGANENPPPDVVFNHDDTWVETGGRTIQGQNVQFWAVSPLAAAESGPLLFELNDRKDPVQYNGYVLYEIAVTNQDEVDQPGIQLVGQLPSGTEFVDAEGPGNWTVSGGTVTFDVVASLAPGEKAEFQILGHADAAGLYSFEATMSADYHAPVVKLESTTVN